MRTGLIALLLAVVACAVVFPLTIGVFGYVPLPMALVVGLIIWCGGMTLAIAREWIK